MSASTHYDVTEPSELIRQKAHEVISEAGAETSREKAVALFNFVRDTIKFGFTGRFDEASPEETLKSGLGHCNPQAGLFASLCNAVGVEAQVHFVQISNAVLFGVLGNMGPKQLTHGYTEVRLAENPASWTRVDGYIVDLNLYEIASRQLAIQNRREGYGIHANGIVDWDGKSDCFVQLADEHSQVQKDFGSFVKPLDFLTSNQNLQQPPFLIRKLFALPAFIMNYRIDSLRSS